MCVVINTGSGPAATQVELSTPPTTTPAPSPGDAQLQSLQDKVCIVSSSSLGLISLAHISWKSNYFT